MSLCYIYCISQTDGLWANQQFSQLIKHHSRRLKVKPVDYRSFSLSAVISRLIIFPSSFLLLFIPSCFFLTSGHVTTGTFPRINLATVRRCSTCDHQGQSLHTCWWNIHYDCGPSYRLWPATQSQWNEDMNFTCNAGLILSTFMCFQ